MQQEFLVDRGDSATAGFVERRRPGRVENVSEHLIPLLRGTAKQPADLIDFPAVPSDELGMIRGLAFGVAVCALFWGAVFAVLA